MVLLVSGTFLRTTHTTVRGNLVRLRKPGSSKRIFSMFVTQMAMPTPFLVANFDQKKPTRWAPLINYWKAMVLSHPLNQYFICHISYVTYHMPYNKCEICYEQETCKNWECDFLWTLKGINSTILYSSNSNFSSNWIIQENWLIQFACNHCWRSCN